jgi:hypothetical protein
MERDTHHAMESHSRHIRKRGSTAAHEHHEKRRFSTIVEKGNFAGDEQHHGTHTPSTSVFTRTTSLLTSNQPTNPPTNQLVNDISVSHMISMVSLSCCSS